MHALNILPASNFKYYYKILFVPSAMDIDHITIFDELYAFCTPIKIRQMALTHFMQIPSSDVTIFPQMVITPTRL